MKCNQVVLILFLLFINFISAQKDFKAVHPTVLKDNTFTAELLKSLPENCNIFKLDLTVVASGALRKTVDIEIETLGKWLQKLIPSPKKGDKIIIMIRKTNCKELHDKEYKFILNDQSTG